MEPTITFATATALCAAGAAVSIAMDPNTILTVVSIAATGVSLLITIVTLIVSFVSKLREKIKAAKAEDSDGGSKVTQAELEDAIKSALQIVSTQKQELEDKAEALEELSKKISGSKEEQPAAATQPAEALPTAEEPKTEEVKSNPNLDLYK